VLHLRVASATSGPTWGDRCVALDLELLDTFRGDGPERKGDHLHLIIRQSLVTRYTSRPAGAWWIVEQSLEPGSEYVAFCPTVATASLRGSCNVQPAAGLLADLRFARDAETRRLALPELLAGARAGCRTASYVAPGYIWERHRDAAMRDPATFDAIVSLVEEPACSPIARATLFDAVQSALGGESLPHRRRLVRAMFRLLEMPEAIDLHDNLVGVYLPSALGLTAGTKPLAVAAVFGSDAAARTAAASALRNYKGPSDASSLRVWIGLATHP